MKYKNDLVKITNCPPCDCERKTLQAYRFVFEPVCMNSFIPQGKKSPVRICNEKNDKTKCSLLALSMFITEAQAIAKYQALKKKHKNIHKIIGTHLAKGQINDSDGLVTKYNHEGHFDFFEFLNTDLTKNFVVLKDLGSI